MLEIVNRSRPTTTLQRQIAIQVAHRLCGAGCLDLYRRALKDRDHLVQTLAVAALRCDDDQGRAASNVADWATRRLKGRRRRQRQTRQEIPLAVAYFAKIDRLQDIAAILCKYEHELDPVDLQVIDHMWPPADRQLWARHEPGGRPDLRELGFSGYSNEFFHRMEDQALGWAPAELQPFEGGADDDQLARDWNEGVIAVVERLETKKSVGG